MTPQELAARFEQLVDKLGGDTAAGAMKVYAAWQAGLLATDEFAQLVADMLSISNAHARAIGDVFATAAVNDQLGMERVPLGSIVSADADLERLGRSSPWFVDGLVC